MTRGNILLVVFPIISFTLNMLDEVFVGTLNQLGAIEVKATKVGEDTSLSKLIRLVKETEEKKAPVVRVADKMATVIVPLALALSVITYLFTKDITRAVTILVVFCPYALVLATPTAIMAGIGNATKQGILIKSGEAMEKAGKINTIAFDKTGTITYGKPVKLYNKSRIFLIIIDICSK